MGRPRKRWRANFILRIKEQETRLTLQKHDDDDDDDDSYLNTETRTPALLCIIDLYVKL